MARGDLAGQSEDIATMEASFSLHSIKLLGPKFGSIGCLLSHHELTTQYGELCTTRAGKMVIWSFKESFWEDLE